MRVYIAGPMTGTPNYNYDAFDAASGELRNHYGHEVFSPAEYGRLVGIENFDVRKAFAYYASIICGADAIYMLSGWEKSVGARAEHALAVAVGCRVIYENEDRHPY